MEATAADLGLFLYCITDGMKAVKRFYHMGMPMVGRKHQENREEMFQFTSLRSFLICFLALSGIELVQQAGCHLSSGNLIKEVIPVKVFFFQKAALNQYTGDNSLEQD